MNNHKTHKSTLVRRVLATFPIAIWNTSSLRLFQLSLAFPPYVTVRDSRMYKSYLNQCCWSSWFLCTMKMLLWYCAYSCRVWWWSFKGQSYLIAPTGLNLFCNSAIMKKPVPCPFCNTLVKAHSEVWFQGWGLESLLVVGVASLLQWIWWQCIFTAKIPRQH